MLQLVKSHWVNLFLACFRHLESLCSQRREGDGGGRGDIDGEGDQARGGGGVLGDVGVDRPVALPTLAASPLRVDDFILLYYVEQTSRL